MLEVFAAVGWLLAAALVLGVFFPSFTEHGKAKGKNLADKEDVAQLTRLVEEVRHENQLLLEAVKGRQQLRLAAAELRLRAHQDAYLWWRRLANSWQNEKSGNIRPLCDEAQAWWDSNCLYLSAEARSTFLNAIQAAVRIPAYSIIAARSGTDKDFEEVRKLQGMLSEAGDSIVRGADLPPLGGHEAEHLRQLQQTSTSDQQP